MKTTRVIVGVAVLLTATSWAHARSRVEPSGRDLFLRECARCHGTQGRGDGPDAPFFTPAPRDLTTGFLAEYEDEELVGRLRDGNPLSLSVDVEGRRIRAKRVENVVAHMGKLPSIEWAEVDAGGVVYGKRCEVCHGPFGHPWPAPDLPAGVKTMPRDLSDPEMQTSMTDAQLARTFVHGRGSMPGVPPKLAQEESDQLVAFLRILSPGFETYSFYCAACHGDAGRGNGILPRDGQGPDVVFDEEYFGSKDQDELRAAVWHMMDVGGGGMPHFRGVVEDENLEVIVEYLKRRP